MMIKNSANIITLTRFGFALALVFVRPFSALFWLSYLGGGISDLMDGIVARAFHQQSKTGAKLDSIADLSFAAAIAVVAIKNIQFSAWVWIAVSGIATLRLIAYGIDFWKFRTFSSLHTYANKAAGVMIFLFPLLYVTIGMTGSILSVCFVAFASALEELILTIRFTELNRDCKGMFF